MAQETTFVRIGCCRCDKTGELYGETPRPKSLYHLLIKGYPIKEAATWRPVEALVQTTDPGEGVCGSGNRRCMSTIHPQWLTGSKLLKLLVLKARIRKVTLFRCRCTSYLPHCAISGVF